MIKLQRRKEFTRMKAPKGPDHFQSHTLTRRRVCWISGWMTGNCQTFKNITHLLPQLIVNMSYQVTFPYIQSVRLGILKKLQSQLKKCFFQSWPDFQKWSEVFFHPFPPIENRHRFGPEVALVVGWRPCRSAGGWIYWQKIPWRLRQMLSKTQRLYIHDIVCIYMYIYVCRIYVYIHIYINACIVFLYIYIHKSERAFFT